MPDVRSLVEDKRLRLRLKTVSVFISFLGATFSALTGLEALFNGHLNGHLTRISNFLPRLQATNLGAAVTIGSVAAIVHYWRNHRVFSFFGLTEDLGLLFALPSFRPCSPEAFKNAHLSGLPKQKTLSTGPIYAHHNFDTLFRALKMVTELRYANVYFEIDEKILAAGDPEPASAHVDERTVICLGSSSSNNLCSYVMSQYPFNEQPFFYNFVDVHGFDPKTRDSGYVLRRNGDVSTTSHIARELRDDRNTDYAILLRHTTPFTTYFVCAGLDRPGSESNVAYLFRRWSKIARVTHGRDFYFLAKINKHSRHGTPLLKAVRKKHSHLYEQIFESLE